MQQLTKMNKKNIYLRQCSGGMLTQHRIWDGTGVVHGRIGIQVAQLEHCRSQNRVVRAVNWLMRAENKGFNSVGDFQIQVHNDNARIVHLAAPLAQSLSFAFTCKLQYACKVVMPKTTSGE